MVVGGDVGLLEYASLGDSFILQKKNKNQSEGGEAASH